MVLAGKDFNDIVINKIIDVNSSEICFFGHVPVIKRSASTLDNSHPGITVTCENNIPPHQNLQLLFG